MKRRQLVLAKLCTPSFGQFCSFLAFQYLLGRMRKRPTINKYRKCIGQSQAGIKKQWETLNVVCHSWVVAMNKIYFLESKNLLTLVVDSIFGWQRASTICCTLQVVCCWNPIISPCLLPSAITDRATNEPCPSDLEKLDISLSISSAVLSNEDST